MVSNYFRMNSAPNWQLYQYAVSFAPEIENRSLRQRLVKEQREYLGPTRAFDGMVLYLARRLPEPVGISKSSLLPSCISFGFCNIVSL